MRTYLDDLRSIHTLLAEEAQGYSDPRRGQIANRIGLALRHLDALAHAADMLCHHAETTPKRQIDFGLEASIEAYKIARGEPAVRAAVELPTRPARVEAMMYVDEQLSHHIHDVGMGIVTGRFETPGLGHVDHRVNDTIAEATLLDSIRQEAPSGTRHHEANVIRFGGRPIKN